MHERSLAEDILRNIQQLMAGHGSVRPVRLKLMVGEFAGVDARLLLDATSDVLAEVGYEGVAIDIDSVPLQANCRSCDQPFAVERFRFECPWCGGRDVSIEQGESVVLESVTLESDEDGLLPDAQSGTAD